MGKTLEKVSLNCSKNCKSAGEKAEIMSNAACKNKIIAGTVTAAVIAFAVFVGLVIGFEHSVAIVAIAFQRGDPPDFLIPGPIIAKCHLCVNCDRWGFWM